MKVHTGGRPKRQADCHPERKHFAKGFCRMCYERNRQRVRLAQAEQDPESREQIRRLGLIVSRKRHGCLDPHGDTKTGPCEICGRVRKLNYDHNHATGLFRGWLCMFCNVSFGWFENNRERILTYGATLRK